MNYVFYQGTSLLNLDEVSKGVNNVLGGIQGTEWQNWKFGQIQKTLEIRPNSNCCKNKLEYILKRQFCIICMKFVCSTI